LEEFPYLEEGVLRESTLLTYWDNPEDAFSDDDRHLSDYLSGTDSEKKELISLDQKKNDDSFKNWTSENGLEWYFEVLADDYNDPKHTLLSGELKPCRPLPQIRASDFFGGLVSRKTDAGLVWLYEGNAVNGWSQLVGPLELRSITAKVKRMLQGSYIKRFWDAAANKKRDSNHCPNFPKKLKSVRVRVRSPSWSARGWSEDSPGNVFYIALRKDDNLNFCFGINIIEAIRNGSLTDLHIKTPKDTPKVLLPPIPVMQAKYCHMIAHRYVTKNTTLKDRVT
jgi:hypothetical protein